MVLILSSSSHCREDRTISLIHFLFFFGWGEGRRKRSLSLSSSSDLIVLRRLSNFFLLLQTPPSDRVGREGSDACARDVATCGEEYSEVES